MANCLSETIEDNLNPLQFRFLESCAGKMESLFDLATSNSEANLKIESYTFVLSLLWIEGG